MDDVKKERRYVCKKIISLLTAVAKKTINVFIFVNNNTFGTFKLH